MYLIFINLSNHLKNVSASPLKVCHLRELYLSIQNILIWSMQEGSRRSTFWKSTFPHYSYRTSQQCHSSVHAK